MQSSTMLQLIDEQRKYYDDSFLNVTKSLTPDPSSKEYFIVSIIGVQNSGKSTLSNNLFGTQFKVLATTAGTQTTKGIWIAKDSTLPLLVLDVEGNDSMERASQNDNNFEKTVAMYALALSNLLIVNIWTKSVGTFEGSQYGILKILMEMSMKMFKQEAPKVILFCLRDFNEEDNLKYVTTTITDDVEKLWNEIEKPQNLQKTPRDRFFKVKVHALRRYRTAKPEGFLEDIAALRTKLTDSSNPDYLFSNNQIAYNLPLKDLTDLSQNVWHSIIENRDLNLPNEKVQLASLRCNIIKDQIVQSFHQQLKQQISAHQNNTNLASLNVLIQKLLEKSTKQYEQKAASYEKKIVREKEQQLKKELQITLQDEIQKLSKTKRDHLITQFDQSLKQNKDLLKPKENSESTLTDQLTFLVQKSIKLFQNYLDQIKFTFPQKRQMTNAFETSLKSIALNKQKKLEEDIKQDYDVRSRRLVEGVVADVIANHLDVGFWKETEKEFNKVFDDQIGRYANEYRWVVGQKLHKTNIDEKKSALFGQLKSQIRGKLQIILIDKLLEGFKKRFIKDSEGNTHNWLVMEDKKIEQIFETARQQTLYINRVLNDVPNFSIDSSETPDVIREELFDANKLSKLNDDLETKMTQEYENTIRSKKQTQMSKVPWYLWLIFLFFTYDDLWFGEDHPFVYYPSMIVLSILALLLSMGYKDQLFAVFTFFMQKLKERFSFLR